VFKISEENKILIELRKITKSIKDMTEAFKPVVDNQDMSLVHITLIDFRTICCYLFERGYFASGDKNCGTVEEAYKQYIGHDWYEFNGPAVKPSLDSLIGKDGFIAFRESILTKCIELMDSIIPEENSKEAMDTLRKVLQKTYERDIRGLH
jgi:hypothetical protein